MIIEKALRFGDIRDIKLGGKIENIRLIVLAVLFLMAFANFSFHASLFATYPFSFASAGFSIAIMIAFTCINIIVLALVCHRWTIKPLLILIFLCSSFAAYFMDSYHVTIDSSMVGNTLDTDPAEILDLISGSMLFYIVLLGILPAVFVYRADVQFKSFGQEAIKRGKLIGSLFLLTLMLFSIYSANTYTFIRAHKVVRLYANPSNYIASLTNHIRGKIKASRNTTLVLVGEDATLATTNRARRLVILVAGETARADKFSLNGYEKQTNPLLEKQNVVSFGEVISCGTTTLISLPCMFSIDGVDDFDSYKARYKENALDILNRVGIHVLWRDNNSSSKHTADRVRYEDYKGRETNTLCDIECRDVGMLVGLQDYINNNPRGDIFIVLHQMGNHGPAYYKRYPKAFEKFTPICETNELSACSKEEIVNTYDNIILYTDYFLHETIELLKQNNDKFQTAMLYISDHGESLGENGLYLHGLPNFIAPKNQRHVPMIFWKGGKFNEINMDKLKARKDTPLTHDNIFHTILGLMKVETKVYDKDKDALNR